MPFVIIHISDLHFHRSPPPLREFSTKRMLGSFNLWINRGRKYPIERAYALVKTLETMPWDHLVISGDLTTLGLDTEFQLARDVLAPLLKNPEKVTIVPGNHDNYVNHAQQDPFQKYFGEYFSQGEIKSQPLTDYHHLIGWNGTHPNFLLYASGTVRRQTLLETKKTMDRLPPHTQYILVHHYPVWFPPSHTIHPKHELYNLYQIQEWLYQQPQIRLYLHGHVHGNWHFQMDRGTFPPISIVNSASTTEIHSGHLRSSFHKIVLSEEQIEIEALSF